MKTNKTEQGTAVSNNTAPATKSLYSFYENEKGEVTLMIDVQEEEPDEPRLLYDGKMALLNRNYISNVLIKNIAPEAHEALKKVTEIKVLEVINDEVVKYEYTAPIKKMSNIARLIM